MRSREREINQKRLTNEKLHRERQQVNQVRQEQHKDNPLKKQGTSALILLHWLMYQDQGEVA